MLKLKRPRAETLNQMLKARIQRSAVRAPATEEFDSVAHFFCCEGADQVQQAPHLFADGYFLGRQDDARVCAAFGNPCRMQVVEVAAVERIENPTISCGPF